MKKKGQERRRRKKKKEVAHVSGRRERTKKVTKK